MIIFNCWLQWNSNLYITTQGNPSLTNGILDPSYSKMYGAVSLYNELFLQQTIFAVIQHFVILEFRC